MNPQATDNPRGWDFEDISMPYIDSLYNTAYRMARNAEDAEDLVQETYLKAYRYYDKFEEGTNFKAWIFKILKNSFINLYRKKQRVPPQSEFGEIEESFESSVLDGFGDRIKSPEDELMANVLDEDVQKSLEKLPDDYRMAVVLADLEGFSYKEIAEILEIPLGTVMSRLYRGRKQMEKSLLEYAQDRGYIRSGEPAKRRSAKSEEPLPN